MEKDPDVYSILKNMEDLQPGDYICVYHANCLDGFGAAWAVRQKWIEYLSGEGNIYFHPGIYSHIPQFPPDMNLIIVDFSYKRPVMETLLDDCRTLLICDHHKTAIKELEGFGFWSSKYTAVLDIEHSGAILTWKCLFNKEPPRLLSHIEDRDLWKFALPGTREINATLFSYPYNFELWDKLMTMPVGELLIEGRAIDRRHMKDIEELIKVTIKPVTILGYTVPCCNLPYTMASDAGARLAYLWEMGELAKYGFGISSETTKSAFVATYYDTVSDRIFSLRSLESGADVSLIAKQLGGGGHKHAAGFKIPITDPLANNSSAHYIEF